MKHLRIMLLVTLCLALLGTQALAREVIVTRIDNPDIEFSGVEAPRQDCQVGNLNAPAFAITNWVYGNEVYGLIFDPLATCACPLGFDVETVHMYMQFGAEDVPATFEAYVNLAEAEFDPDSGCWLPGTEVCVGEVYSITIDTAGLYDISLPLGESCECAAMEYMYMLSFHILTAFPTGMEPDAVSDDIPTNCTSWNDYGAGWVDLVADIGWPGNISLYADVMCCEFPVGDADNTWGGIKNLYR